MRWAGQKRPVDSNWIGLLFLWWKRKGSLTSQVRENYMTNKYPTLTIRLPQDTLDALRIEAQQNECSVAEIVKTAIALYYNQQYGRTTSN